MSKDKEPDWVAELAESGDEVQHRIELLAQVVKQLIRDGQRATMSGGAVPPLRNRFLSAVGAAMRELGPARQPVVHQATASLTVTPVTTALPRVVLAGDVATASESATVVILDSRRGPIALMDRQTVRVLVWMLAVVVPWLAPELPPELQTRLSYTLATFAIAYEVTRRPRDKRE
jgi:hypothetical protein